jgi:hypothetical protein
MPRASALLAARPTTDGPALVTRVGNATHINLAEAQKEHARHIVEPFRYDAKGQRLQGWESDPLLR